MADASLELTSDHVKEVSHFIQVTVLNDDQWDGLVNNLRMLLDTVRGKKFVKATLAMLTLEASDPKDLAQDIEFMCAPLLGIGNDYY